MAVRLAPGRARRWGRQVTAAEAAVVAAAGVRAPSWRASAKGRFENESGAGCYGTYMRINACECVC